MALTVTNAGGGRRRNIPTSQPVTHTSSYNKLDGWTLRKSLTPTGTNFELNINLRDSDILATKEAIDEITKFHHEYPEGTLRISSGSGEVAISAAEVNQFTKWLNRYHTNAADIFQRKMLDPAQTRTSFEKLGIKLQVRNESDDSYFDADKNGLVIIDGEGKEQRVALEQLFVIFKLIINVPF